MSSLPTPLSPIPSPTLQPSHSSSSLSHALSLNSTDEQNQLPLLQLEDLSPIQQTQFQMVQQFTYSPQLTSTKMQPILLPTQHMYAPLVPSFRSSIDIFKPNNATNTTRGTNKLVAQINLDNAPTPLDSTPCTNYAPPSASYPVLQIPNTAPYSLTPNFYYPQSTNDATPFFNTATPISPTPVYTSTPSPSAISTTPILPSTLPPLSPALPLSTSAELRSTNVSHPTNCSITYNTSYNGYDSNVTVDLFDTEESEFESGASLESAGNSDASMDAWDACAQEASEENETEEEGRNDSSSDSDYEEEEQVKEHSHRIKILVYPTSFPPPSSPSSLFPYLFIHTYYFDDNVITLPHPALLLYLSARL